MTNPSPEEKAPSAKEPNVMRQVMSLTVFVLIGMFLGAGYRIVEPIYYKVTASLNELHDHLEDDNARPAVSSQPSTVPEGHEILASSTAEPASATEPSEAKLSLLDSKLREIERRLTEHARVVREREEARMEREYAEDQAEAAQLQALELELDRSAVLTSQPAEAAQ